MGMSVAIAAETVSRRDNVILNGFLVFCQGIGKLTKKRHMVQDFRIKSTVRLARWVWLGLFHDHALSVFF